MLEILNFSERNKQIYKTLEINENTSGKIYNVMRLLNDEKKVSFEFEKKKENKTPLFTIHMKKEYSDIVDRALTNDESLDNLPDRYKKLVEIKDMFENKDMGFKLVYTTGKRHKMILENIDFNNNRYLNEDKLKYMGFKFKENNIVIKSGIRSGEQEEIILGNFIETFNQNMNFGFVNIDSEYTFKQKLAKELSKNNFLSKQKFIDLFIKSQLKLIPDNSKLKEDISNMEQADILDCLIGENENRILQARTMNEYIKEDEFKIEIKE